MIKQEHEKALDTLRNRAISTIDPTEGIGAVNMLAVNREEAIPRLMEISGSQIANTEVKETASYTIEIIKGQL
jgi:hypothetical protein